MTREEVKRTLEDLREYKISLSDLSANEKQEICDAAISALSTEGEYIKKEDALFKKWQFKFKDVDGEHWFVNVKDIESLHTYSFPDREKGEWIDHECDSEFYRCSKCHICWTKGEVDNCNMNFCPNCGADMRESIGEKGE